MSEHFNTNENKKKSETMIRQLKKDSHVSVPVSETSIVEKPFVENNMSICE